jgi:glycosyltransferase AglD
MFSVFIPAYNEGQVLEGSVRRVLRALDGFQAELFIVDDGSTDGTADVARRLAAEDPRVRVLRYDSGPSRRENLAASFAGASGEAIAFIDADLSAGPENLPGMAAMLGEVEIVIGSRNLPESRVTRNPLRKAYTSLAAAFTRIYFGSCLSDYQCGIKVFRRDAILALTEEAGYDGSFRRGFSWDTEILLRAQRRGYRIREVPVRWVESRRSSVKPLRDWRMIPYVIGLRRALKRPPDNIIGK